MLTEKSKKILKEKQKTGKKKSTIFWKKHPNLYIQTCIYLCMLEFTNTSFFG